MSTLTLSEGHFRQFLALTKPRVVSLVVFCAVIGMFLATPELPGWRAPYEAMPNGLVPA